MLEYNGPLVYALCLCGADIVLTQRVQHARLGKTGDVSHGVRGKRYYREHIAGVVRAPDGHPAQLYTKYKQQQGCQYKARYCRKQSRKEYYDAIRPFVAHERGNAAEYRSAYQSDGYGAKADLAGYGEGFGYDAAYLAAVLEGYAEVALEKFLDIDAELHQEGFIQVISGV